MTTAHLMVVDHVVAFLNVATWLATGAVAATRRARLALALLAVAVLLTLSRLATVGMLSGRGWWFVQEKVLLNLPMLGAVALAAVVVAGPPMVRAARRSPEGRVLERMSGDRMPASVVVLLLATGYTGLAGLAVTFLGGYPLTWRTTVITIGAVGAGVLLTVRVVATSVDVTGAPDIAPPTKTGFSRRRFLLVAGGAVVAGTGASGVGSLFPSTESVDTGGGPGQSSTSRSAVSVTDLRGAGSPSPGGTIRRYALTARTATLRLPSGREIHTLTYNGQTPGPPITATVGDLIEVTLRNNNVHHGVTLHWHGYDVPCGEDGAPGVTQDAIAPGDQFTYRFRADQAGTYWYHTHQTSHVGVRMGLYGTLVVTPPEQRGKSAAAGLDLTLPVHTFDGVVMLGHQFGRTERTVTAGTTVRLRLVNTDSTPHRFALTGTPFRVHAVDGRDLHQPGEVSATGLRLPAGGRYDLVFVMPETSVALVIDDDHTSGLRLHPNDHAGTARTAIEDTSRWPELDLLRYGTPDTVPFDTGHADRRFTLVLDRGMAMVDGRPAYAQTVNGRGHPSIPDQLVSEGDIVRFTVVNRSLETHPWHLHGHPVLVLSRNGKPASGSPLWMDTFDVRPGEVWDVAFQATNPGIWMNHCHNLPHAHQGMMLRLRYDGVTSPFDGNHTTHPR